MIRRRIILPTLTAVSFLLFGCSKPSEPVRYVAYATIDMTSSDFSEERINTLIEILESNTLVRGVAKQIQGEPLHTAIIDPDIISESKHSLEKFIDNHRIIRRLNNTRIVQVGYVHTNPEVSAQVANLFTEAIRDYNHKLNIGMTSVEHLTVRAANQLKRVEEIEAQLVAYGSNHNTVIKGNTLDSDSRQRLSKVNKDKLRTKNQFDAAELKWHLIEHYKKEGEDLKTLSFINADSTQALSDVIEAIKIDYQEAKIEFNESSRLLLKAESELLSKGIIKDDYDSIAKDLELQRQFYDALKKRLAVEQALERTREINRRWTIYRAHPTEALHHLD